MKQDSAIIAILAIFIVSEACVAAAGGRVQAAQLIQLYSEHQAALGARLERGLRIQSYTDTKASRVFWSREESRFCFDGDRVDQSTKLLRDIGAADAQPTREQEEHAVQRRAIWNGQSWYDIGIARKPEDSFVKISADESWKDQYVALAYPGGPLAGYFPGDEECITDILGNAENVSVRDGLEEVNGVSCYVVEATTASGRYAVWIAPEHGYNIAKGEVRKTGDDIFHGKPVSTPHPEYAAMAENWNGPMPFPPATGMLEFIGTFEASGFRQIDGVWVPMKVEWSSTSRYEGGRTLTDSSEYERLEMDLSPDFDAAGAFVPDIPDGTKVRIEGENPVIPLKWRDGEPRPDVNGEILKAIDKSVEDVLANIEHIAPSAPREIQDAQAASSEKTNTVDYKQPQAPRSSLMLPGVVLAIALVFGGIVWALRHKRGSNGV